MSTITTAVADITHETADTFIVTARFEMNKGDGGFFLVGIGSGQPTVQPVAMVAAYVPRDVNTGLYPAVEG